MSEIVKLIQEGVSKKDKEIYDLYYKSPYFQVVYKSLIQEGKDNPEQILKIIINLCGAINNLNAIIESFHIKKG